MQNKFQTTKKILSDKLFKSFEHEYRNAHCVDQISLLKINEIYVKRRGGFGTLESPFFTSFLHKIQAYSLIQQELRRDTQNSRAR
jgi:hypothetical protein